MNIPREVIQALSGISRVKENEPLLHYTTYHTGGPADALVFPDGNESVPRIVKIAREAGIPVAIIGGGSNLLVSDKGINGLVVRLCEDDFLRPRMTIMGDGSIYADACASKESFMRFAVESGYEGVEFMAGIPGCLGGGIMMNAGTYMGTFADIVKDVDVVDESGECGALAIDKAAAEYRNMHIGDGRIVTGARFTLPKTDDRRGVWEKINGILADRKKKHPLDFPSAGSVFKNPPGHSSWKLINDAGLKGKTVGGACVSDLHTNFIINVNNASSHDILGLIEVVRETVLRKFGVELETEVRMIGR